MLKALKVTPRKFFGVMIGNILLGIGIGIFKYAGLGNDPFSGMVMSVNAYIPLSYAVFLIILNSFIFVLEAILGKKYIGFGTIINWFLVGYVVQYSITIMDMALPIPEGLMIQLGVVGIGVIIASLGLSLYQTADAGVAPYDSLSLIVTDRFKIQYFWSRIIFDATCAIIIFFTGGLLGLGTLVCAFGLGPVVAFFNKTVSEKVLLTKADG